jgi:hypothetical protein
MAKNNNTRKPGQKRVKTKKTVGRSNAGDDLDLHAKLHALMLYDPCSADLSESVYPGDRGYVNRFTFNQSFGIAPTDTIWAMIIKPGNQVQHASAAAVSTANTTISYSTFGFPGLSFLATNASKSRAIAHCVTIVPNSAPNTATGNIHYGVVNAAAVANGKTVSFDTLISYCTERVSCSQALMAPIEVKWSPGGFDDRYNQFSATLPATADDDSDRNALIIVMTGYAAGTGAAVKSTSIQEWSPNLSLGVVCDATSVRKSRCDIQCVLRNLKRKDVNWWWKLGTGVAGGAVDTLNAYYSGGPSSALRAARNSYNKMSRLL